MDVNFVKEIFEIAVKIYESYVKKQKSENNMFSSTLNTDFIDTVFSCTVSATENHFTVTPELITALSKNTNDSAELANLLTLIAVLES